MRKSKRRANREGSIYRRKNGQWIVALTIETLDGSTKRVTRNAKSQQHGQIVLLEMKEQYRFEKPSSDRITVSELADRWLASIKGEPSTIDNYKRAIEKRIKPHIGTRKCDDVTVPIVEQWLAKIAEPDEHKKVLGLRSQEIAFDVLSRMFGFGMRRRLVSFNPCEPDLKPKVPEPEIHPFTDQECKRIFEAAKGDRLEALHHLAFAIGPRQGELFGLQWRDVDWDHAMISIQRQARDYKGYVTIKIPKTRGSRRTVPLPRSVMDHLIERRKQALKEGRANPDDFIFTSREGFVIRRTNFGRRHWKSLLKKAGVAHRGHHHVRHTAATNLLRSGMAVHVVAHILGHSSPVTTQRTYAHYISEDRHAAAEKMQEVLSRMIS